MKLGVKKLRSGAMVPEYQTAEAAGADLHACLDSSEIMEPGEIKLIGTGLALEFPKGFELQVRTRSGLASKHGIVVLNSPGTIDSDYRGELKVILINHGKESFKIENGERIAQMVIAKHETATFEEVEKLSESTRGEAGLGSTGK